MEGMNDPLLQTGILLAAATLIWTQLMSIFSLISNYLIHQIGTQIELGKESEAHGWILDWLSSQENTTCRMRSFALDVQFNLTAEQQWRKMYQGSAINSGVVAHERPKLKLLPGEGLHLIWTSSFSKKRTQDPKDPKKSKFPALIFLTRTIDTSRVTVQNPSDLHSIDRLKLWTFGNNKDVLLDLIDEAMEYSLKKDKNVTVIYEIDSSYGGWTRSVSKRQRSLESVVLDDDIAQDVVSDAKEFFDSQDWYAEKGVPFRRGYLFYGEPGCGKTSFTAALAGALNLNVCHLTLSKKGMGDQELNSLLHSAPMNSLILLEDIDCAFPSRRKKEKEQPNIFGNDEQVTFSGLLNVLDGLGSQEGRIYVMTTNHIERLDPALIRPGRVDRRIHFRLATKRQIIGLTNKFYPSLEPDQVEKLASMIGEDNVSMAQLQGHFLRYKRSGAEAIEKIEELLNSVAEERKMSEKRRKEEQEEEDLLRLKDEEERENLREQAAERERKKKKKEEEAKENEKKEEASEGKKTDKSEEPEPNSEGKKTQKDTPDEKTEKSPATTEKEDLRINEKL